MRANKWPERIAALFGMAFFWACFRFQAFFGALFPLDGETQLPGFTGSLYPVFLACMFLLSLVSMPFYAKIEGLLASKRPIVLIFSLAGMLGVVCTLLHREGLVPDGVAAVSAVLVTLGFFSCYLSWAFYFSSSFDSSQLVLLASSYLLSLLLFRFAYSIEGGVECFMVLTPMISGLMWFMTTPSKGGKLGARDSLKSIDPFIGLFILFIIAGSIIRGMVDVGSDSANTSSIRPMISISIGLLILLTCLFYWKRLRGVPQSRNRVLREYASVRKLSLFWWVLLVLLFFFGVFISFLPDQAILGGHLVVVARSSLDFFLWVLLCALVRRKDVSPTIIFLACSVFVEILSWTLSYVVIPKLFVLGSSVGAAIPSMMVTLVGFLLVAAIMIVFLRVLLRRNLFQEGGAVEEPVHDEGEALQKEAAPMKRAAFSVPEEKATEFKLTAREIEVIGLFAQGLSLKKTASELFISVSTAQTHIKSVYKKVGIHSKDELIELIGAWNSGETGS